MPGQILRDLANIWQQYVKHAVQQELNGTTLSAFNPNVDVLTCIDNSWLKQLMEKNPDLDIARVREISVEKLESITTREDFIAVLLDRLTSGKSLFMVNDNPEFFTWLEKQFPDRQYRLGGQAGIMANQLAALNARSVLYSPILSPMQAEVMRPEIRFPCIEDNELVLKPIRNAVRPADPTRSPWVVEYAKGEEFDFGFTRVITPRANRLIISRRIKGLGMNFTRDFYPYLPRLGRMIDVALVAGYHLGGPDPADRAVMRTYFRESARALGLLREENPKSKIHLEYVPMKEADMEVEMLSTLTAEVDSFGINETEIKTVLALFGEEELARDIKENERAYALYRGGLALMRRFKVERVHIHNLGYYVVVLHKPYHADPVQVRQACLYGSSVNAHRALNGGYVTADAVRDVAEMPLSDIGLHQLEEFAREVGRKEATIAGVEEFTESGIIEFPDHYVVVVPTHVVPNPVATVGMGDTISSSSYAMEVIGRQSQPE